MWGYGKCGSNEKCVSEVWGYENCGGMGSVGVMKSVYRKYVGV